MGMRTKPCRGCGQQIGWLKSAQGKPTPVDPDRITIMDQHGYVHQGYVPHHITCPDAGRFRKGRSKE